MLADEAIIGRGAQRTGKLKPGFAREHEVQHDELEMGDGHRLARLRGIAHGDDLKILAFQEAGK